MHDPDSHLDVAPLSPLTVEMDFEAALKKRTELKRLFRNFNIVIQKIGGTKIGDKKVAKYVIEIQISTPEEREKVLKHRQYKKFAPYITLEAVGVKRVTESTTESTQKIIDFYRGDQTHFIQDAAVQGLANLQNVLPPSLEADIIPVNHANREAELFQGQRFALKLVVNTKQAALRILKDEKMQPFLPFLHVKVETKKAA